MGTRTFVNLGERLGIRPADGDARRPILFGFDVPLLLITLSLLVFGILMVYSASWDFSYKLSGDPMATFHRQLTTLGVGIVAFVFMAFFNYRWLSNLAIPAMVVTLIMLLFVVIMRDDRLGASRALWGGSYQPSELAKLMIVVYLSVWLYAKRESLRSINFGLIPLSAILGIVGGLILLQPDLSATLTILILGGVLFFLAGGDMKQITILLGLGMIIIFLIVTTDVYPTGRARFDSFWAGIQDLLKSSDHVKRSIEAFARGGWFGLGIGRGQTKLTGLPFPHTDSIFAVIGEETGVVGAVGVVLLYMGLLWRGLAISNRAKDGLGRLLAGGLAFWVVTEASINMAVMVGLMPFAGNALPLISSGGSSLVMTLAALGIMMNVARQSELNQKVTERTFNAIVDLRGRDWRRRVSGAGSAAGAGSRRR